jgi:hypothetical protein
MAEPSLRTLLRPFKAPCLLPRRKRTLWSQPYMVRPALVKAKFGDGKRLLGLMPIMHRPCYYLVWIDSSWDIDGGVLRDHLDEMWAAIAEEFGERPYEDERPYRWPEEDASDGCSWFEADAFDVLPPRMRRRYLRRSSTSAK